MGIDLNLFAAVLLAGPLERWAEGFGSGAVKGAVIGVGIAIVLMILKGANSWGGSAATQARLAARGQPAMGAPPLASGSGIGGGRLLRGVLLFCAAVLCGLGGMVCFGMALQIQALTQATEPTPQPLTLAQLLEKGPGKNVHVELQQFAFGNPVIEKDDNQQWQCVWMVLTPTPAPTTAKTKYQTAVLRASKVHDQEGLDALRQQATLDVLATSTLADTLPVTVKPSATFLKSQPKLVPSKTAFLTDAEPLDASWGNWLWGGAGVLGVLGSVLFFLIFFGGKKKPEPAW